MNYNIIASGSSGNAVIIDDKILVDLGVAYSLVEPFLAKVKYLLLTHRHGDHFNISAIIRMAREYPDIKIIASLDLVSRLNEYRLENVFLVNSNEWVELGDYTIATVDTIHDVPNVAYRIMKPIFEGEKYVKDYKIFYSTDTRDLFNVEAKGYDLYFIEFNHCEEIIQSNIEEKKRQKVFAYEMNATQYHQSNQRANKWLEENNTARVAVIPLHISKQNNSDKEIAKYVT